MKSGKLLLLACITVLNCAQLVVASNRRLWLFVLVLFVLPAIFLTSGIWIGPITG